MIADSAPFNTGNILDTYSVQEACDYTNWAYTSYIDLSDHAEFYYLREIICPGFYAEMNTAQKTIDENQ